jgi:hypothetical protein
MKVKTKTLKGWARSTYFLGSQNVGRKTFDENLEKFEREAIDNGFKKLSFWDNLRGKNATEKIIVKGWKWNGNWGDPTKEIVAIYYR